MRKHFQFISVYLFFLIEQQDEDWFEIPHSSIKEIGREIGKGAFGRVFVARISDIPGKLNSQIVAIKKLKSESYCSVEIVKEQK